MNLGNGYIYLPYEQSTLETIGRLFGMLMENTLLNIQLYDLFSSCKAGDIRIRYHVIAAGDATIIGKIARPVEPNSAVHGTYWITDYVTSRNYRVGLSKRGQASAADIFESRQRSHWWSVFFARLFLLPWAFLVVFLVEPTSSWPVSPSCFHRKETESLPFCFIFPASVVVHMISISNTHGQIEMKYFFDWIYRLLTCIVILLLSSFLFGPEFMQFYPFFFLLLNRSILDFRFRQWLLFMAYCGVYCGDFLFSVCKQVWWVQEFWDSGSYVACELVAISCLHFHSTQHLPRNTLILIPQKIRHDQSWVEIVPCFSLYVGQACRIGFLCELAQVRRKSAKEAFHFQNLFLVISKNSSDIIKQKRISRKISLQYGLELYLLQDPLMT